MSIITTGTDEDDDDELTARDEYMTSMCKARSCLSRLDLACGICEKAAALADRKLLLL